MKFELPNRDFKPKCGAILLSGINLTILISTVIRNVKKIQRHVRN